MLQAYLISYLKQKQKGATAPQMLQGAQSKFKALEIDMESLQWCLEELADRDYV